MAFKVYHLDGMANGADDTLRQILAPIEREFQTDWLLWNSGHQKHGKRGSHKPHPLATAWLKARNCLAQLEAGGSVSSEDLPNNTLLAEMAADLDTAVNIPNFAKAVRPRLKSAKFEKAQFEMHIGASYKRSGQHVEFIPPSRQGRMADLKVILDHHNVFIECTRKDPYQPERHDDSPARESLLDDIKSLLAESLTSLEVIVVVFGALDPRFSTDVLGAIRQKIAKGDRGVWTRAEGLGLVVRDLTPVQLPPGAGVGPVLPATLLSPKRLAFSEAVCSIDEKGQPYVTREQRGAVYVIDAHRMTSVIDSFRHKQGQIPKSDSGVVYIDLDVSHIAVGDVDLYMHVAQNAVQAALTTPPGNSQIGAVVLMSTPIQIPVVRADGTVTPILNRRCSLIQNPHGTLPAGFTIPGPPKKESSE